MAGICNSLLPVELVDFNSRVNNQSIQLNWRTASEEMNAGFELQRSTNGKSFQTLTFIEGKGTTNEQQEYSFEDKELDAGQLYYYRLKQIDFDGRFEYSEVITAQLERASKTGTFFPNPSINGQTILSYSAITEGQLSTQVYDATGKILFKENQKVIKGNNQLDFDFSDLGTGMFFVKMEQNGQSFYQNLILK